MNVPELLNGKRVCVCTGSGGVGKTTTSAVIGLGMAARGLKVCVITIDPARRLANALGLDELSNEPRRVPSERFASAGLDVNGELWAMMLDPKRTFDNLIDTVSTSEAQAAAIKANGIYQQLSGAVAGSQEFTAVSKLYELALESDFDLLVLDTPPARNALDFLDAPGRLTAFLEGRALQAFLRPTGFGLRVVSIGVTPLVGALKRITGVDLVSEITTFLGMLGPLSGSFSARARGVDQLLASDQTAFLLVCSAQTEPIDEAIWFRQSLRQRRLSLAGVVVNRFHHDHGGDGKVSTAALAKLLDGNRDLAARVAATFADYHVLAARDDANLSRLRAEWAAEPVLPVPQFDSDIHDTEGLARVHAYLFGSDAERDALIARAVA
jgi:anion-transporting  ArsA/GET3 family ATPase